MTGANELQKMFAQFEEDERERAAHLVAQKARPEPLDRERDDLIENIMKLHVYPIGVCVELNRAFDDGSFEAIGQVVAIPAEVRGIARLEKMRAGIATLCQRIVEKRMWSAEAQRCVLQFCDDLENSRINFHAPAQGGINAQR